jgi:predicted small integral membrane protein
MNLNWMAWTQPTVAFFLIILFLLVCMTIWELKSPGGAPRRGILRFETTRGDRLFISLLGSAYIHIFWLALISLSLWWALGLSLIYALCVFKWV